MSGREIERDYRNGFRVVVLSYVRETHTILILISLHSFQVEIDKGAALDKFQH